MSDDKEREDYDALLKAPGWLRLLNMARQAYGGDGYGRKVKEAIAEARAKQADVEVAVEKVDAASDAVNWIVSYPQNRLRQLTDAAAARHLETHPPVTRRGSL